MVNRKACIILFFLLLILYLPFSAPIPITSAQVTYTVNKEWVHLWINQDASMDLQYNITYTYLSGSPQGIFTVGIPKGGFKISYVRDLLGNSLTYSDVSQGSFYGIDVTLKGPIVLNHPYSFLVYAIVPGMVSTDSTNPGNVGMSFYPTNFPDAIGSIGNVRVLIVLPDGVTSSEVKYPTGIPFDNVLTEGTNVAVYWERNNWSASQQLTVGVSFPAKYVTLPGPNMGFFLTLALFMIAIIILIVFLLRRRRKAVYEKPKISIEALGAARGLTAVEAAVVVGSKPVRVLMMILFGLLKKRSIMVKETTPLIKLETVDASLRDTSPLRYYEIDFLKAIGTDGSLDERNLARAYLGLRDNVDKKMRSYSRVDTVNYYKSVVDNAWAQVTRAGTPELKGDAIEGNMEWLLIDENYDAKFKQAFPPNIIFMPSPGWWWYWHGPNFPNGPVSNPAGVPTEVKPIPAQEWANSVVRGLETTTNNIVKNVQDFTNKLVAPQSSQSSRSVREGSSCVCACAHCACACACVGCACACAHGGGR